MLQHIKVFGRIFNVPLLLDQNKLNILSTEIGIKLLTGEELRSDVEPTKHTKVDDAPKIGIVKVFDTLVSKNGGGSSGSTSYEHIQNQINHYIASGAESIGFYIDSPGGEASGNFPLTHFIKSLPEKYGISTFAFSDGSMTSGAYSIASATQRIYATESTTVGSIAAIMSLIDATKADEKDGYKYHIIRSLDGKAIYNPHEAVSKEIIDKMSEKLTEVSDMFISTVNKHRPNLTVEDIIALNGDTFLGHKALEKGLVDSIVTSIDEVFTLEASKSKLTTVKGNTMTIEELKEQLAIKEKEIATIKAETTNMLAKGIADERARCLDILEAGKSLKISQEQVSKRISAGTSKEDTLDIFTAISEAVGNSTAIDTSESPASITESTIIKDKGKDTFHIGDMVVSASDILSSIKTK